MPPISLPKSSPEMVRLLGQHLDPNEGNGDFGSTERAAVVRYLAEFYNLLVEMRGA